MVFRLRQSHSSTFSRLCFHVCFLSTSHGKKQSHKSSQRRTTREVKLKSLHCLFRYYYDNFLLVAISVDSLYLFSISYFAREDAYSMYSPIGYVLQHPLQHPAYNQQFLPNIPHQYYGPAMISSLQMMAPPFSNSPAHAAQTSTTNATTNEDSGAQRKNNRWTTQKKGS